MRNPLRYFNTSPEVIRLVVMLSVRFPLSLRRVEDLLFERGIDIRQETVRFWWSRFSPMFAAEIRRRRVRNNRCYSLWRWRLDEVFVRINGETARPLARRGSRRRGPQGLCHQAPRPPRHPQADAFHRPGRVAPSDGLKACALCTSETGSHKTDSAARGLS